MNDAEVDARKPCASKTERRTMRKTLLAVVLASLPACPAFAAEAPAKSWSIDAALVSDYVFRGISQTGGDPALQAGFKFTHASGWYAGAWGSGVDFGEAVEADAEIDGFVGYGAALGDEWSADLQVIRYTYAGTDDGVDLDFNELIGTLSYRDNLSVTLAWTDDVYNLEEQGLFLGVSGGVPLPAEWSLDLGAGYYSFGDETFAGDEDDYRYWTIGVSRAFGPVSASLAYYDTDSRGEEIFGSKFAGDRVALSLGTSF
jgi:uncharacterized protein (TIGR02001 family)